MRNLGIRYSHFSKPKDPVLKSIFRDPASPVDKRLKVTICAPLWKQGFVEGYERDRSEDSTPGGCADKNGLALEEFGASVVGDYRSQWDLREIVEDDVVFGEIASEDIAVRLEFRREEE